VNPLVGRWTYRSFINDAEISKGFDSLEFGRGELLIEYITQGMFIGRLIFGDDYQFGLYGVANFTDTPTLRFQGFGDASDSQNQVYDYLGCLMPYWPQGIDQRPTIVGSVVRTVPHDEGKARAGVVSSFIALKR
jgi:hypothetical protein